MWVEEYERYLSRAHRRYLKGYRQTKPSKQKASHDWKKFKRSIRNGV